MRVVGVGVEEELLSPRGQSFALYCTDYSAVLGCSFVGIGAEQSSTPVSKGSLEGWQVHLCEVGPHPQAAGTRGR